MNFEESNVEAISEFINKNCDERFQDNFRRRSSNDIIFGGIKVWSNKELPRISLLEEKKDMDESNSEEKIRLKDDEIKALKKVIEDCIINN